MWNCGLFCEDFISCQGLIYIVLGIKSHVQICIRLYPAWHHILPRIISYIKNYFMQYKITHPFLSKTIPKIPHSKKANALTSLLSPSLSLPPNRCFFLQNFEKDKWETLMAMESHNDLRRGTELWDREQVW